MCVARSSNSLRHSLIWQVTEVLSLVADLVGIAERYAQQALTMGLDRDDMLSCGKYHPSERDHAFFFYCLSNHHVRLSANLPIRGYVVRMVQIEIVDIIPRDELLDIDRVAAFDRHCLEFILGYFD